MSIYPWIYQNYWRFFYWKHNNKTPYYLKQLRKSQYCLKEEIEKLQLNKLKRLVNNAYKTVPYYKKIMKDNSIHPSDIVDFKDFQRIPILTKLQIRKNPDNLIAVNVKKENIRKDCTSGSTGEPLIIYKDRNYSELATADRYRSYEFSGYRLGDKMVRLWGAQRDTPEDTLSAHLSQKLSRNILLITSKISENDMVEIVQKLKKFKPNYILGYSNSLYFFAKFFEKNNIKNIIPKSVISSAEMLYDYQRELISRAFSAPVFNHYGCREVGSIACECDQHNGLHILAENQYIEIIGRNGENCDNEEIGKIIVTNLNNYSFPLIRYEIGDMARKSNQDKCNCKRGLPLLDEICGRTVDNFILPGGNIVHPSFFYMFFYKVKGIEHIQIIQEEIKKLVINIVKSNELNENEINKIIVTIKKDIGDDIDIKVNYVREITKSPSGKLRITYSKVIEDYYNL